MNMAFEDLGRFDTAANRYEYLRDRYGEFVYKGYSLEDEEDHYHVEYLFEITGLSEFRAKWDFPKWKNEQDCDSRILKRLIFSLGMVEAISYYKITCPKSFIIDCTDEETYLTDGQLKWWRKLLYNGLGEFMYRNGIVESEEDLVDITQSKPKNKVTVTESHPLHDDRIYDGCLVPVGGGKDSVVSLELLKDKNIITYVVNGNSTTSAVIERCDHRKGEYTAHRVLDKTMLELNGLGYLNGHTPFSAIVAFSSTIAAYITGRRYITLSNETSANESTVKDSFVNHQYSKSYEFEKDYTGYLSSMTDSDIHYFSFLRPLTELQIAGLFAKAQKYHEVFRSCNVGSKTGIWCCNCPKCLFVYIILLPFLSEEKLVEIFGEKLLDKESLDLSFRELTGIEENKPFECVGTRREVCSCVHYYRSQGGKSLLTDRYADHIDASSTDIVPMIKEWSDEHGVPEDLKMILKNAVDHIDLWSGQHE